MISLDISLVWVIINLLVLYLLLKKFLFKPVCKMMDERSAKIQSDLDGRHLLFEHFEDRRLRAARPAPRRPKVHERAPGDLAVEIAAVQFLCHSYNSPFFSFSASAFTAVR